MSDYLIKPYTIMINLRHATILFGFSIFFLFTSNPIIAQDTANQENEAILKCITSVFDGMRGGDSSLVSAQFLPDATLQTTVKDSLGQASIRQVPIQRWLEVIARPKEVILDERIYNVQIYSDDVLGMAWTPYQFYVSEDFSHCGVNVFQFLKTPQGWKITSIIDTRREENCPE